MLAKKALSATAGAPKLYVEDVFNTYLTTGAGSAITVTNDIDLSGEGGLVWTKTRNTTGYHVLFDTERGADNGIYTNTTDAQATYSNWLSFNNNGFTIGTINNLATSSTTGVSFTFRKAEKFFDVVTWTGDGTGNRNISHSLGSVPGCIIVKCTSTADTFWEVWHRSLTGPFAQYRNGLYLNTTAANDTIDLLGADPTSTQFNVARNTNGRTYVAYLFAHDAGGFGDSGSDSVIKCGSFTTNSIGNATVDLGWEPQWFLMKNTTSTWNWFLFDTMRGWDQVGAQYLYPNLSNAETSNTGVGSPTATGFTVSSFGNTQTHIYIAIRRGPMKTPEAGTEVFEPFVDRTSIGNKVNGTMGPVDLGLQTQVSTPFSSATHFSTFDRLRGSQKLLATSSTNAEGSGSVYFDTNQGVRNESWFTNGGVGYNFKRAPGFFDVVCYTGTGSATTQTHNLGVAPEMMIVKRRNTVRNWAVYVAPVGTNKYLKLNLDFTPETDNAVWNNTAPTSTVFSLGTAAEGNGSGDTYVAYLFASVTGVSKVGSYTGNGSSQTINCGFTGGSRFVLIKRTDSTGDWVVFDSARGIVSGNDPYLLLNSTAAEVTDKDAVDTDSTGFVVNETSGPNINTNGGTYIYLAIA